MNRRTVIIPVIIIILSAVILGAWLYYSRITASQEKELTASGTIEAPETDISSLAAGQVIFLGVKEGDSVKKGQRLVTLDDRIARDQVKAAQAQIEAAEANVRAAEEAGDDEQRDVALAQVKAAKAAKASARVQLSYTSLTSPIAGRILSLAVEKGENVTPGSPVMTIGRLDDLTLSIFISEDRLGRVKLGQVVDVSVDSFSSRIFKGKVTEISDQAEFTPTNIETKEQRVNLVYEVKVDLPNKDLGLKPGMPADATVIEQ